VTAWSDERGWRRFVNGGRHVLVWRSTRHPPGRSEPNARCLFARRANHRGLQRLPPPRPVPCRGPRSEPPRRSPRGGSSRHESRWSFREAGLFDPGLLLGVSPRTRSCSHDIFAAGTPTLMCFPGAELLRIDDAPTPSASELEMSTPLSKSREHRSRGPKPQLRSEPPKRHEGKRRRSRAGPKPRHLNEQY
jgi:hypothetical protein